MRKEKMDPSKLIESLKKGFEDGLEDPECKRRGHPNSKLQVMSTTSGDMHYCPDCNCYIDKPLTLEQQMAWHKAMTKVYL